MANENMQYIRVEPYSEVLNGMSFILSISAGVVKLTGITGAGKTALCNELQKELRSEKIQYVHFPSAPATYDMVEQTIQSKLKLDTREPFIQALTRHIMKKSFEEQRLIVIFDDAEHMNAQTLAALIAMRNLNVNDQNLVSLVFSGTNEMEGNFTGAAESLMQDVLVSYHLDPMNKEQLKTFCLAYLEHIKLEGIKISDEKLEHLLEISGGLPGKVPELIPTELEENESKQYVRKKKQKEFVTKATRTLTKEFVDPLVDEEAKTEVIKRWKGPLGGGVIAAGIAVFLFVGYAAYVFIPDSIIPLTVSYFSDEDSTEPAAGAPQVEQTAAAQETVQAGTQAEAPVQAVAGSPTAPEQPGANPAVPPAQGAAPAGNAGAGPEAAPAQIAANATPAEPQAAPGQTATEPAPEPEETQAVAAAQNPAAVEVPAVPATPDTAPSAAQLRASIDQWLLAWENKNLDAYFSSYDDNFNPQTFNTLTAWQEQRRRNITRAGSIDISIDDFEVVAADADSSQVRFQMEYRSPTYADRTMKEISLARNADGRWLILEEDNLQVQRLALTGSQDRLQVLLDPPVAAQQDVNRIPLAPGRLDRNLSPRETRYFNFLNDWLVAWQDQDLSGYFSHYRQGYIGADFSSADAWQRDRMTKISRPSYIQLSMSDFQVLEDSQDQTLVQFSLEYRSAYYADRTLKEVLISTDDNGKLSIASERNRQITLLPIYRRPLNATAGNVRIPFRVNTLASD